MRTIYLSILLINCLVFSINAQEISDSALGLRVGYSEGIGAEISYQRAITDTSRLEFDFGWRDGKNYNGFKAAGLYHWIMTLNRDINWYIGGGGGIGSYKADNINTTGDINTSGDEFLFESDEFLFVAGNLGVEYYFDIPLLLSLDIRPEIGFWDDTINNDDIELDIALGLKYQF